MGFLMIAEKVAVRREANRKRRTKHNTMLAQKCYKLKYYNLIGNSNGVATLEAKKSQNPHPL